MKIHVKWYRQWYRGPSVGPSRVLGLSLSSILRASSALSGAGSVMRAALAAWAGQGGAALGHVGHLCPRHGGHTVRRRGSMGGARSVRARCAAVRNARRPPRHSRARQSPAEPRLAVPKAGGGRYSSPFKYSPLTCTPAPSAMTLGPPKPPPPPPPPAVTQRRAFGRTANTLGK